MESEIMLEVWKDIPEYEGYYQVSSLGRVRSVDRVAFHSFGNFLAPKERHFKGRILRQPLTTGYPSVKLSRPQQNPKTFYVHRLIGLAFIDGYFDGAVINHIDGCRANNILSNLEFCTQGDNIRHASTIGLTKKRFF